MLFDKTYQNFYFPDKVPDGEGRGDDIPDPEPADDIPDPEPAKVLTVSKPKTILSELTRFVKALGGNARKSSLTIASQLSALADIAEAGEIGGSGSISLHVENDQLDKTWAELNALKDDHIIRLLYSEDDGESQYIGYLQAVIHQTKSLTPYRVYFCYVDSLGSTTSKSFASETEDGVLSMQQ